MDSPSTASEGEPQRRAAQPYAVNADLLRGAIELMILAALKAGDAHGYALMIELRRRSSGALQMKSGTLYPALDRLGRSGLVTSLPEIAQGRRRRVYTLTPKGVGELERRAEHWRRFSALVDGFLSDASLAEPCLAAQTEPEFLVSSPSAGEGRAAASAGHRRKTENNARL